MVRRASSFYWKLFFRANAQTPFRAASYGVSLNPAANTDICPRTRATDTRKVISWAHER